MQLKINIVVSKNIIAPIMSFDCEKDGIILTCYIAEEDLEVLKQGIKVQIK